MKNTYRNKYFTISAYPVLIILAFIFVYGISPNHLCFAEKTSHLLRGLEYYNSGNYDEALNEFKAEIEINKNSPLVYYYAAHIRLSKGQYPRAVQNLEAALRDSSDFHDAHGLLAYILLKMGENRKALDEWNSFVRAIGPIEENTPVTAKSIMIPEEYHEIFKREARIKELERLETERREGERLRAEKELEAEKTPASGEYVLPDSVKASGQRILGTSVPDDRITETEIPLEDLGQRVKADIRNGIYGIIVATVVLGIGVIAVIYWIRKRRAVKEEKNFSEEVERLLSNREFELDEEKTLQELETKRRELVQEFQSVAETPTSQKRPATKQPVEETKQALPEKNIPDNTRKTQITEEIKALVSRLSREGHSPEQIAQTADLTKTEVKLILAVRESHLDNLIDEIKSEEEDSMDRNQLIHAINNLSTEGVNTREIAKRLSISSSEVELASSIIEMRKKNYEN